MKTSIVVAAIGTLLGSTLIAGHAAADTPYGYVCTSYFGPQTDYGYGKSGYISFTLYSGPSCTGSYLGYFYAFSKGQTNTTLLTDARLYSEAALLQLDRDLTQALTFNKKLDVFNFPTATWLLYQVRFWAN
jgi:hypothetical protein